MKLNKLYYFSQNLSAPIYIIAYQIMFDKLSIHLHGIECVQKKPSLEIHRVMTQKNPTENTFPNHLKVTNLVSVDHTKSKVLFDVNEHVTSILKTVTMRSIVCSIKST